MSSSNNLGQVQGLYIGTSAPTNTKLIWYDSGVNKCHKVYDSNKKQWVALNPQIVTLTTYSELKTAAAQSGGLTIGQLYQMSDKGNILAIVIASTKILYADGSGNVLVDDLGNTNGIEYHVSSDNLNIDGIAGEFSTTNNMLTFTFNQATNDSLNPNINDNTLDTVLLTKHHNGSEWEFRKFRWSKMRSKASGNSLSWSGGGLFFSFANAIKAVLNVSGGVLGYSKYLEDKGTLEKSIENANKTSQETLSTAKEYAITQTSASEIYGKQMPQAIDTSVTPAAPLKNDTLFTVLSKLYRYITKMVYATGIKVSSSFTQYSPVSSTDEGMLNNNDTVDSALRKLWRWVRLGWYATGVKLSSAYADATSKTYVAAGDTLEIAIGKIQYMIKNPTSVFSLPSDWSDVPTSESSWKIGEVITAGDTLEVALAKINQFWKNTGTYVFLSPDWEADDYTGTVNLPDTDDSLDTVAAKLTGKLNQIGNITNGVIKSKAVNGSSNPRTELYLSTGTIIQRDSLYQSTLNSSSIKLTEIANTDSYYKDLFRVDGGQFQFIAAGVNLYKNSISTAAVIETTNSSSINNSVAFQAINGNANGRTAFDAFFQRLKISGITYQAYTMTAVTYSVTHQSFILYNAAQNGDIYLPDRPDNGRMIMIAQVSSGSINIHASGADRIDTINESAESVTLSSRGTVFAFFYLYGFSYSSDPTGTTGLWQCARWNATF